MADPAIPYTPFTLELGGLGTVEGALKWNPTTNTWGLVDLQITWATPHPLDTLPEGLQSLGSLLQLSLQNWGGRVWDGPRS